ncbi:MAG: hypothetical protein IKY64_09515 [Bacteroidaceae bacterium]|nr:hypothetical protein [Bacteroidaceae bacterium]
MRKRAQQSNRTFMLGTLVLGILVVGIVIMFTALAFDMGAGKQEQDRSAEQTTSALRVLVKKGFHRGNCSIYLNDSVLFSGSTLSDTILVVKSNGEENAIIVVDHETQGIEIVDVPAKEGLYRLTREKGELQMIKQ